jgi:hypothetical protein
MIVHILICNLIFNIVAVFIFFFDEEHGFVKWIKDIGKLLTFTFMLILLLFGFPLVLCYIPITAFRKTKNILKALKE